LSEQLEDTLLLHAPQSGQKTPGQSSPLARDCRTAAGIARPPVQLLAFLAEILEVSIRRESLPLLSSYGKQWGVR